MSRVSEGDDWGVMRRAPRLWEQQLTDAVVYANPGGAAGASGPIYDGVLDGETPGDPDPTVPTDLPTPSAPTWTSTIAMLAVRWDGLDDQGAPWPVDTKSWVECHVGEQAGFTPTAKTNRGTYQLGAGAVAVTSLKSDTDYWLRLVGRDELGGMTVSVEVKAHTGMIMDGDIGKGVITADKVSFDAREIGGVTTGIGTSLPTDAKQGDIFLLKVVNPDTQRTTALKQYQFDGSKWNAVEWGAEALSAGSVAARQIVAGSITSEQIATRSLLAEDLVAGTITVESGVIGSLDADKITAGTIAVERLRAGTLTGQDLKTPRGPDGTQIWVGDPDGSGSDYIRFYKNGNIKGLLKFADGGGIQIGGFPGDGGNDPLWITGSDGMYFVDGVIPDATYNANHRVLGVNAAGRLVGYKTPPKDAPDTPTEGGQNADDLRALVRDLQAQVAALAGRLDKLEAAQ